MNINRQILRLAIPNILSNISVPLIASVDTGLMGHSSAAHLAAIGTSSMVFNFMYWNFGFLRMGATGMIAQAHGAKDHRKKSSIFFQSTFIALFISLIILMLQNLIVGVSFDWMNLSGIEAVYGTEYFKIRVWDAPATLMLYVIMGWFFGSQNSIVPFILTVIINVANIGLSVYFVQYLDMGIKGVAYGSVIGNYMGMIVGLLIIITKKQVKWEGLTGVFEGLQRFLSINKDIFIRTFLLTLTFTFLYSQTAIYGAIYLGANVVLLQFLNWMSYGVDGFAYAAESLIGRFKGEENPEMLHKTVKLSLLWGGVLALVFSLFYAMFFNAISQIFTNDIEVLTLLKEYYLWIVLVPILGFASYIWDGIFIGMTASKSMRNAMIVSFIGFILTFYLFKNEYGYNAVIAALTVFLVVRGIVQTWLYLKFKDQLA